MKKTLLTLLFALAVMGTALAAGPDKVQSLMSQYKNHDGFESVSVGPVGLFFIRTLSRFADIDKEDMEILKSFNSIKKLSILDFEDAPDKEMFAKKVAKALKNMDLILEAKEDGDRLSIYGVDDGRKVKDCILFDPDGTLICVKGSLDLEKIMTAAQE